MSRARGFTLIEVMVYLAVLGIVAAAATPLLVASVADRKLGEALAADSLALRRTADAIERDVRSAATVWNGVDQLLLSGADGQVGWTLDGCVLRRRGPDGDREFLRRVESFEVVRSGGHGVTYAVTLLPRTAGASRRARISGTVVPRVIEEQR